MRTRPTRPARAAAAAALCLTAVIGTARPAAGIPAGTPAAAAHAKPRGGFEATYPSASPLAKAVGRAADAALDTAADGDLATAEQQADAAFDLAVRYATARDVDAVREAAYARRLAKQLADAPDDTRADLLAFLRAHPVLGHAVAFAVRDGTDVGGAYKLLDQLRRDRPKQLALFPELAAALCVVRDRPLHRGINENTVRGADPLAVFDFYVGHERQMFYGLRGVPVELLCYVVDTTASIDDLNWAVDKYAFNRDVGALFFTIKYDYDYFNGKAEKKVDVAPGGFNLPNILKCGGVCVDQAYFATSVGKAIGVPSAIASASSAEAGHAWVGFLKAVGRSGGWDFNSGRYAEYQGLRGDVTDPQTDRTVADSTVGLLGDLIGSTAVQRQDAVALVDAAERLGVTDGSDEPPAYPAALAGKAAPPVARAASAAGQLELIELGLRQFASYPRGWERVAGLAKDGKLTEPQKRRWADLVQRLCGKAHPDFAMAILDPMVESVADPAEQTGLWDGVFKLVAARPDLAAEVRFRQAKLWERRKDLAKAGQCYEDVVQHYINAGPFALKALGGAEAVLKEMGQGQRVLDLYAAAAKAVAKPGMAGRSEFMHQSNWYKVREAYAAKLADAGQTSAADAIRQQDKG